MIIGRIGRLKTQPPAKQASSERTESGRPKQIHNAGKERIVARKYIIILIRLLKGHHNCINLYSNNPV